jgi:signal transduction histidine kinase
MYGPVLVGIALLRSISAMNQDQLERLLGVGPALAEGLDLEVVLRRILDAAREVTGARYAALGVLDEGGEALERFLPAGLSEDEMASIGDLPRGHGVLGELIRNPEALRLEEVGDHARSYGFPVGHPPMHSFLGVPIRVRGKVYGNLYLTEKHDGQFDADDEEIVARLADWAGIAIDNARLFGNVRSRHAALERTVRVLETNVEINRAIGTETDVVPVLDLVVKRARALVGARGVAVALLQGGELVVTNVAGRLDRDLVGYRIPLAGDGENGAAARVRELPDDLHGLLARVTGADGALVVPLVFRDTPLGVITAVDRLEGGPRFDSDDERLLQAFASSASIAVASAQRATQQSLRRSIEASEEERVRWARELHDETLQDIGALRVGLSTALHGTDDDLRPAVEQAVERLGDMGGSLRGLIADLRPAVLDQLGVGPALDAMVERLAGQDALIVDLRLDLAYEQGRSEDRLAPALEVTLYRVVQEALNNVIKHAGTEQAEVRIAEGADEVELEVRDGGRGFDPSAATTGFGLTGLRERVEQLGGTVEIASGPARGTVVHARMPVVRRAKPLAAATP